MINEIKRFSNHCSDRIELYFSYYNIIKAKICELVVLKLLSSLTLWNNEVIATEKDHHDLNDLFKLKELKATIRTTNTKTCKLAQ